MANDLDVKPASQVCTLLEFRWGSQVRRYASWTGDVVYAGDTYTSQPGIAIEYGRQDGTTKDQPAEITMKVISPLDKMRTTHPPVTVKIWELNPGNDLTAAKMWAGRISIVRYNADGNPGVCKATIEGWKSGLECSISLVAGRFCPWTFGSSVCGKDIEALKEPVTITAIDNCVVTVSGLTTTAVPNYWRFGYIKIDGFPLQIHSHELGTSDFVLCKPPPTDWASASGYAYPGCSKEIESCRFWGRESSFGAMGIRLPNRQVQIEE